MTEYRYPASVDEALRCLEAYRGKARLIAGGTDLMPDLLKARISPRCLVDITRIPGLVRITVTQDFVEVGAAVTFAAIRDSAFLNQHVLALADAAGSVGATAIQSVATWAGNIVQAMPAADGAIVALALNAEARLVDGHGEQWRPVESLFIEPGVSAVDPCRQMVTHLRFPRLPSPSNGGSCPLVGTAWRRIGRRPSLVLPILACAVKMCLSPDGGRIERASLALGPVAPVPYRARATEVFLRSRPPTGEVFAQAGRVAQGECHPRSNVLRASREYRLAIIPALVSDALSTAALRALSLA